MRATLFVVVLLTLLWVDGEGRTATYEVGSDLGSCTHSSLAGALSAAQANDRSTDTIRVHSNYAGDRRAQSIVDHSVRIVGGYAICSALTSNGTTYLQGQSGQRLFTVAAYPEQPITVELRNLELSNGAPADAGGAVAVFGSAAVTLRNTRIRGNRASRGGGVYLDGMGLSSSARLVLDASRIDSNLADIEGAGIYCRGGGRVELRPSSFLSSNGYPTLLSAVRPGGGAFLDQCSWYQTGGRINDNRALLEGAGLYAGNGSQVWLGWGAPGNAQQPSLVGNVTGTEGFGQGGAVAAVGPSTRIELFGTMVQENAARHGAAFYLIDGASLSMQRDAPCGRETNWCSDVLRNIGGGNSATVVEVARGAKVSMRHTRVVGNTAVEGTAGESALFDIYQFEGDVASAVRLHGLQVLDNRVLRLFQVDGAFNDPNNHALDAQFLTLCGNTAGTIIGGVDQPQRRISLRASIIDESTPLSSHPAGPLEIYDCLLSRSALSVANSRDLIADPMLDFKGIPQRGSPAIDFCSAEELSLKADMLSLQRGIDDPGVLDRFGPVDLGAIEILAPIVFPPFL